MILLLEVRTESAQAVKTLPMHCDVHQALSRVAADPEGRHFQAAMQAQLNKINDFYRAKELQLEVRSVASLNAACFWEGCKVSPKSAGVGDPETPGKPGARALTAFRADCADLRKYAVVCANASEFYLSTKHLDGRTACDEWLTCPCAAAAELHRGNKVMQEAQQTVGGGVGTNPGAADSGSGAAQPAVLLHVPKTGGAHDGGGDHLQGSCDV